MRPCAQLAAGRRPSVPAQWLYQVDMSPRKHHLSVLAIAHPDYTPSSSHCQCGHSRETSRPELQIHTDSCYPVDVTISSVAAEPSITTVSRRRPRVTAVNFQSSKYLQHRQPGCKGHDMAPNNVLALSGLLHDGNFLTWKTRMNAVLWVNGLREFHDDGSIWESPYEDDPTLCSLHAAKLIRSHVSPDILERVPQEDRKDATRLLSSLEQMTLRFRFLDLPAEVRTLIYEHVFAAHRHPLIWLHFVQGLSIPAISRTSSQLRKESLPLFLSSTAINVNGSSSDSGNLRRSNEIATMWRWTTTIPCSQQEMLRTVTLALPMKSSKPAAYNKVREVIKFTFSSQRGLEIQHPPNFDVASKNLLDRHAAITERNRKLLGLRGEAIVLALVGNAQLWEYGRLQTC